MPNVMETRTVSIVKQAGERLQVELTAGPSHAVLVKSVSAASPLSGSVFPFDRIISCNGASRMTAAKMATMMVAHGGELRLEVITPEEQPVPATRPPARLPLSYITGRQVSRHHIAASQAKLFAEAREQQQQQQQQQQQPQQQQQQPQQPQPQSRA